MGKRSATASVRSKKAKPPPAAEPVEEEKLKISEITEEEEKELTEVSITIENYHNIQPAYTSSNIFSKCHFSDKDLGETEKIILTDESALEVNHRFHFKCNTYSPKDLDRLVSNPVLITIIQTPLTDADSKILPSESSNEENMLTQNSDSTIESVISLYEALTGDVVEVTELSPTKIPKQQKKKEKSTKKKKKGSDGKMSKTSSKGSKKSKSSLDKKKRKKEDKNDRKSGSIKPGQTIVGCCIVDLLPLVFGKTSFQEFIPIIAAETYCDDRMTRHKFKPGLVVKISIDKPIEFTCKPKILHLTFESIYNIPSIMNDEMEYHLCILLPSVDLAKEPVLIRNCVYTTKVGHSEQRKLWPEIPRDYYNQTHYMLDQNAESIKNYVENVNLQDTLSKEKSRIEFNCIKRNVLSKDGFFTFYDQARQYQKVVLEIHAFKKSNGNVSTNEDKNTEQKTSYLHLMAIIDLSPLMYPGATKIRVAVPLTTFHEEEAANAGLEKSYFFPPKPKIPEVTPAPSENVKKSATKRKGKKADKKSKSGSKSSKTDKSSKKSKSSKRSSKSDKGKGKKKDKGKRQEVEDLDMKNVLPTEPAPEPPPEPSIKVYNENGERTFIILEIELTEPLIQKQNIEDLHRNLQLLVHQKPLVPKIILDNNMIMEYYHNVMKAIIVDINKNYVTYLEAKNQCHCENRADFLTYLRRIGAYQNFVSALIQIAALLSQNKLNMIDENNDQHQYQKIVEEIFVYLNSEVNQILHKITVVGQNVVKLSLGSTDTLLFYAKEAAEMGKYSVADRYYLERLYHNSTNADFWYEYAVYKMECNEIQKSFMCLQEALKRKMFHKYSLLMNGILLAEKKQVKEAELCLLTLVVQESRWVEAWVVLYLFYKYLDNIGGMDLAQEMALKYIDDPRSNPEDSTQNEDLAWSPKICPNTIFFKAATLLIKMRLFSWAENALSYELKNTGVVHYMLAVICYYRKQYHHALEHLDRAKFFHGMDFSVASLMGHCHVALADFKQGSECYGYILHSFEKPDYQHLVYINCAKATENLQEARKLWLIACKHCPTPYTWISCGVIYFKLNDLISAEECFSEAVVLDNTLSECWGYLALINLKIKRVNEAELCYNLALKNNLKDEFLTEELKKEFDKLL